MLKNFTFLIFMMVIASVNNYSQKTVGKTEDETAIRQIVKQLEDGWNAHDGKAFAVPFAEAADYVVVNGMYIKGKDSIEKGHTQIFSTVYKDSQNFGTIKSIRFLRPDVAVVHVEWNLTFQAQGKEVKARAMNTMFMTKENDKWSIAAFHNTPIRQPANN